MQPDIEPNRESPTAPQSNSPKARRRWPLVVLAVLALFMAMNAYWMLREVERIRRYKASFTQTNAAPFPSETPKQ